MVLWLFRVADAIIMGFLINGGIMAIFGHQVINVSMDGYEQWVVLAMAIRFTGTIHSRLMVILYVVYNSPQKQDSKLS